MTCHSAGRFCLSLIENDRVVSKNSKHFNQILSHSIASGLFQDPFVSSKLLLLSLSLSHSNANNLHFPHTLFSQIQNPNIFAWNFMFKAYSHSNTNSNSNTTASPQQCISLYNLMRRRFGLFPDRHSFPFLFKACARLSLSHKGQELHSLTFKLGLQHDVFVQNALLSMYSFCGLLHNARLVFDEIPLSVRDVVSWNSMVSGCIQGRCYWDALKVFDEMLKCDVNARPDEVTFINALTACARIGFLDMGRKIHGLLVQNEFVLDVILGSSLVDMYTKCGQMEHARKVFDTIPDQNVVCWTCLIAGYARSHLFKESIELFREMQARTIACVISSCGHSGALDQGREGGCTLIVKGQAFTSMSLSRML